MIANSLWLQGHGGLPKLHRTALTLAARSACCGKLGTAAYLHLPGASPAVFVLCLLASRVGYWYQDPCSRGKHVGEIFRRLVGNVEYISFWQCWRFISHCEKAVSFLFSTYLGVNWKSQVRKRSGCLLLLLVSPNLLGPGGKGSRN